MGFTIDLLVTAYDSRLNYKCLSCRIPTLFNINIVCMLISGYF